MRVVKLVEISELKTGPFGTQFSANEYVIDGIPVINVKNIGYGNIIETGMGYVGQSTVERLSDHRLQEGDIVFGRKGSVDRHCLITKVQDGWMQGSDCIRVRITDSSVLPSFVSYYLLTDAVKAKINNSAVGSTMASLNTDILGDIEINLPTYEEQCKIANILSSIDSKIENNNEINDYLEQKLRLLYEHMMSNVQTGGVTGHNTIASALTDIITGKEDANLASPAGKYKFFTCSNDTLRCDKYVFNASSILIAGNGDFNVKHYTGRFNAYQRTYVLMPGRKYYGLLYLASLYQINSFKSTSAGSIVKFITKGDIENIPVFIPDNEEVLSKINHLLMLQEQYQVENDELAALRDWLLPMLMNGQATIED